MEILSEQVSNTVGVRTSHLCVEVGEVWGKGEGLGYRGWGAFQCNRTCQSETKPGIVDFLLLLQCVEESRREAVLAACPR